MLSDHDLPPMPEAPKPSPLQAEAISVDDFHPEVREAEDEIPVESRDEEFHFGQAQQKLSVFRRKPGWFYYWVEDRPGRLSAAQAGGYVFVTQDEVGLLPGTAQQNPDTDNRVCYITGVGEHGTGTRSYLMRVPEERRQRALNSKMGSNSRNEAIRRAILGGKPLGQGATVINSSKFYSPKGGSNLTTSTNLD